MATPKVLLKRSSVSGNAPSAGDLDYGELAINFADGKIYYKDNSNAVKAFVDSARVEVIAASVEAVATSQLDSGEVTSLIDSSYVQARVPLSYLSGLIDSSYVQLRAAFDTKFAAKSTSDLSEGSNLYYTKARADSDIAASLNDSGNTVNITINNTITDTVDSAYVLARVNEAPFLDSAEAIQLIDSTYVRARQIDYLDSSLASQLIDSAYVQLRQLGSGLDSSLTLQLIDSAHVRGKINKAYVDGLGINATQLDGQAGSYYLDYTNATNKPTILDNTNVNNLIDARVDSAYTQLRVSNQGLRTTDSVTFAGITVTGTMTTVHSDNLRIKDPLIHLADSQTVGDQFDIGFVGHYSDSVNGPSKHTGLVRDASNSQYYLFNELVQDGLDSTDNFIQVGGTGWALANLNAANITSNLTGNVTGTVSSLSNHTTDNLAVGSSNLYFTNTLADARVNAVADSAYIELRRPPESVFVVTHSGSSAYTFNGDGFSSGRNNPTLYLTRGKTYKFAMAVSGHPFQIRVSNGGSAYSTGVTNNGAVTGDILFTPDMNAPTSLVYQCTIHSGMVGNIVILDDTDATGLDSALASQLIDSAYIQLRDTPQDFAYGSLTGTPTIPVTGTDFADSAWILSQIPKTGVDFADSSWIVANFLDSALTTQLIDSAYIQDRQAGGGGGTVDSAYVESVSLDSERTQLLIDSAYIQLRQTSVGTGGLDSALTAQLIDSAYIQLRQTSGGGGTTDSATVLALIDSAHVQARQSIEAASPLILTNLIYTADSGQVSFTGADDNGTTLAVDSGKLQVFLNGILLSNADFSHNASKVDLTIAADSADILTVVKIGGNSGVSGFQQKHFIYNADSGQTVFTGAATSGEVLAYSNFNRTNVYLNGIMLISGTDYTAINGTTVTLVDAADSGDVLDVNTFIGSNIGLDSADVTNLIDSAYVTARAGAGTDSAAVLQLIDSAHVALKAKGMDYNILANKPTIPVTGTDFADSAWITLQINNLIDGAPGTLNTLNEIAAALNDDDSAMDTLLALINAKSDVDSVGSLSNVTYGVPTAGQILKYDAGTSKFILATDAGGLDSSLTSQLIDSAYVQARGTGSAPFELTNFIYTADSGQVTFTGADTNSRTLAIDSGKLQVFLNGILLSDADFSHNATKVDLTIAADSADILTIVKMDGNNTTSNFQSKHFIYNADSGQTAFTGAATSGEVLAYSNADRTNVYLNGIMLINGTDFTATNGSTLTLIDAADSGDVLDINVFRGSNISLDSAAAINLIDSAYVAARAGAGTDSATVLNLIDSAHVNLHAVGLSYTRLTNTPTIPGLSTHFIDSAEAIKLITANAIDSSIAIQLLLDSAETINLIDSAHVQLHAVGLSYNRLTNLPSIPVTGTDFADSAYIHSVLPKTGVDFADSSWIIANFLDSALTTQLIDSDYVKLRVTKSDLDMEGNKVLFANVYDSVGSLPSATTYHGMFAHVHNTGAGYFAHAGAWVRLANQSELSSAGLDSALTTQLIDSAYVQLRQSAGGGGSGTVDSAYVEANSLDSERTLLLIDSDYILARVTNTQPGEFNTDRTEFTVGGADSGRRVFDTNNTLSLVSGNTDVFLNGVLQVSGTDYTIDSSAVTFTSGVAANHQVTVLERAGKVITHVD